MLLFLFQLRRINRLLWLVLTSCSSGQQPVDATPNELAIASSDYVVLAQKALTYQADFNTDAWARMLADSIEYLPLDSPTSRWGKAAVLAGWQHWQQQTRVQTMRLSGFTCLPVVASQRLPLSGRSGVHIVTYCTAQLKYTNGQFRRLPLYVCYHFDAAKRIDYYRVLSPNPFLNPQ